MNAVSMNSVMAMRSAILQRNQALRDASTAGNVGGVSSPDGTGPAGGAKGVGNADFSQALKSAFNEVDKLQHQAGDAASAYERGETTDIAAVMLAKQQASVGFETTLQVRNKLLSAYKDIMSMPV